MAVASDQLSYPGADLSEYGCDASLYDEGGLVVFGAGRRALAAANRIARSEGGFGWRKPHRGEAPTVRQVWATFHETCGCTEEQHATHEPGECWEDDCEFPQLPPCGDEFGWLCSTSDVEKPGLLPVIEVHW